jgi:hypothetical protein
MDIPTAVSSKTSVEPKNILLPCDLWKIVIEYLGCGFGYNDDNFGYKFGSILPYSAINKMFDQMIFECITEVKISIDSEANYIPTVVNDIICDCKKLRGLRISVTGVLSGWAGDGGIFETLQQIGNNCTNVEELYLEALDRRQFPKKLFASPNLCRLSLKNFDILPPSNMQNWINLRVIEGNSLICTSWAHAISTLTNLKEIKCVISNQNIIDFCNLCKEKSICNLDLSEVLDLSDDLERGYFQKKISDDGLYSVLDTFLNLTALKFQNTNITLSTPGIAEKLGTLSQLKILVFLETKLFFDGNFTLIDEWLQNSLPYFPKNLEIIECMGCKVSFAAYEYNHNNNLENRKLYDSVPSMIMSGFHHYLPNLTGTNITFHIDDEESDDGFFGDY